MRLCLRNPVHRLSVDLMGFARRFRLRRLVVESPCRAGRLIVVGDGSPENRVLLILASALDGGSAFDVAFPTGVRRYALASGLPRYFEEGYADILIMIDQEADESPGETRVRFERHFNVRCEAVEELEGGRLIIYRCFHAGLKARVSLVVNGLDDERLGKHTIEDHLIRAAEELGLMKATAIPDPKEVWRSLKGEHGRIYRRLLRNTSLVRRMFPQHVKALALVGEGL